VVQALEQGPPGEAQADQAAEVVTEDLSFMRPFEPTGASVSILRQARLPGTREFVYFIEQFLLLGDGLVYQIVRTLIMQRSFGGNQWTGGRFYGESWTAQQFRDSLAGIDQLPPNVVASFMGTETFQASADTEMLAAEVRQIQHFLYLAGVRLLVAIPQPLSRIQDEVRLDFQDIMVRETDEAMRYEFFVELLETVRSRPQNMGTWLRFVHQDNKKFSARLAEYLMELEPATRPDMNDD